MKRIGKFFRELVCRHDLSMLANRDEDEFCIYVLCPKCGKISGHFHLPIPENPKETRH